VNQPAKILIIEDESDIRELLTISLEEEGFAVESAGSGEEGLQLARSGKPSLVLLDLMLPNISGIEICRQLQGDPDLRNIPVLMLTAKSTETDKVVGLEVGADDYVTKPFSPRELVARVKALLRRSHLTAAPSKVAARYEKCGLWIDFDTYEVRIREAKLELSLREFELLRFLVMHPNRVYNRAQLLERVWGSDTYVEPRTVDVHIRRLRKHIEENDSAPTRILTVRGVGYMFDDRVAAAID
jgi:two-component system alkaline phosphatase synthesis response regulator PhoP